MDGETEENRGDELQILDSESNLGDSSDTKQMLSLFIFKISIYKCDFPFFL